MDGVFEDLCNLLGINFNLNEESSDEDVAEAFFEENHSNYDGDDFLAENITAETKDDGVPKSRRRKILKVKEEEENYLIGDKFSVGFKHSSSSNIGFSVTEGNEKSKVRKDRNREEMIRWLMIDDNKIKVEKKIDDGDFEKMGMEEGEITENGDKEEMKEWKDCKRENDEEQKEEIKTENQVEVGKSPVVWIKLLIPERLANGKKAKYYKCIECDLRKEKWYQVLRHWNTIHNPNKEDLLKFVCEKCGKKYQGEGELKVHVFVHGESKYPCKYCGKGFKSPYSLKSHEKEVHETELEPCEICGKMLSAKTVKEHERVVHFNDRMVDCGFCEKTLKTKRNLQLHMEAVHGTVEKAHHCHICDGKFRVASGLRKHIETVHEKTRLFPCPFCETVLSSKDRFKLHSRRLHQGSDLPQELKEQLKKPQIKRFRIVGEK